ncbi:hypothetical protein F5Y12DRAFT_422448 [Xylaria sp. FL1777]|nr:hypothetical protein F5Y12DRAFT_422448 [Xylaria sp. FL1777]
MDFFCVRIKPRHCRENSNRKEVKKNREKTSIAQFEARLRVDPARKRKLGKEIHRRSGAMAPPHAPADFSAPGKEQPCLCVVCRPRSPRPPMCNSNRERGRSVHLHSSEVPAHENPLHSPQVSQVYVHPYSTHHYRFPVVNHSTTCHGRGLAPYPAFYTALVPEAATVYDIELALVNRPDRVGMARLLATGELVHIDTFHCIKTLYEASLQLEVWDSADMAGNR